MGGGEKEKNLLTNNKKVDSASSSSYPTLDIFSGEEALVSFCMSGSGSGIFDR